MTYHVEDLKKIYSSEDVDFFPLEFWGDSIPNVHCSMRGCSAMTFGPEYDPDDDLWYAGTTCACGSSSQIFAFARGDDGWEEL